MELLLQERDIESSPFLMPSVHVGWGGAWHMLLVQLPEPQSQLFPQRWPAAQALLQPPPPLQSGITSDTNRV